MLKKLSILFSVIIWFAVIEQLLLMLHNRTADIHETLIRFFSFFTILTNTLAALYFTAVVCNFSFVKKTGLLTALTANIFMVGIVYQVALRHLWQPTGMQYVVDELLHTVNPVLVIIYWYLYERKKDIRYARVLVWLVYPVGYLMLVLIRGSLSGFYPYPFINVVEIGLKKALMNSLLLALLFTGFACLFIFIGKLTETKRNSGNIPV